MNFLNWTKIYVNQLNHCKTIADSCEFFNYLFYISQEESLVCDIRVTYPSEGDSHAPGCFIYNIKNEDICNLTIHVKRHFENEVNLENDYYWQEM